MIVDALRQSGGLNTAGGSGAIAALLDEVPDLSNLRKYAKLLIESRERRTVILQAQRAQDAAYKGNFRKVASSVSDALADLAEGGEQDETLVPIHKLASEQAEALQSRMEKGGALLGASFGYDQMDTMFMGAVPKRFTVIGARPRMGKTTFLLNLCHNVLEKSDSTVAFYSIEMGREELWNRLLLAEAGVKWWKLLSGNQINDVELKQIMDATARLARFRERFLINERAGDIREIVPQVRRLARRNNIGLIVVDYLQIMQGGDGEKRNFVVGDIAKRLKLLAKHSNVPILAAAQLNRTATGTGDEGRPGEASLAESDEMFRHADAVLFLDRPKVRDYKSKLALCHTDLIIAKNRHGPAYDVHMHFDLSQQKIMEKGEGVSCEHCEHRCSCCPDNGEVQ
jgi:replicative DNA helicase